MLLLLYPLLKASLCRTFPWSNSSQSIQTLNIEARVCRVHNVDVGIVSHSVIKRLASKTDAFLFTADILSCSLDFEFLSIDKPTVGVMILNFWLWLFWISHELHVVLVNGFILISAFRECVIKKPNFNEHLKKNWTNAVKFECFKMMLRSYPAVSKN